ncbi:SDR family oxidoreductase [Actinobacteria bacterium YIM 96077]|uniref:Short-chain dehydrogenase n=1 Tax=Phytoactinopolyspora halophila TaxID=1981511 RepID=A0A329QV39_9ACTN|nr:SDR family oxidoreductase [Phytoactinopolyspora halophila]AYY15011.1 SDR family oxidoreductase [Actinobacteria bacterium YIM 96077]RAW15469.1 short-chain dehydrogenase [Phytoactinopolyspora halophila]
MKTAIVTGATRGIGHASAVALADEGWWVLATGRDTEAGSELQKELDSRSAGRFHAADLTAPGAPEELVRSAENEHGSLDLVVNNAGIHRLASVENTTAALYDEVMTVNLRSAVLLTAAAIPAMRRAGGGTVINVSSEAGILGFPGQLAYNMSKAGLIMLSRSIVADHTRDGIRAVTVSPGTTRTPLVQGIIDQSEDLQATENELAGLRPAGRLGRPEEVAAVITFAASDRAPFMTGAEISVDGGNVAVT